MIVCKFGGSSVTSIEKLQRIKQIVNRNCDRKFIVVSAVGKSNNYDQKLTDLLIQLCQEKNHMDTKLFLIEKIKNKLLQIIEDKDFELKFLKEFQTFCKNLNVFSNEFIISRGEYFTAKVVANYLNANFFDSTNFITFNEMGKIDMALSYQKFSKLNLTYQTVFPGFYGSDLNGNVKLFPRGGGDTSASIIANISNASLYENYTDVKGIFTANPNKYVSAKQIKKISYSQCFTISNLGATVIANQAILPLVKNKQRLKIIDLQTLKSTLISHRSKRNFCFVSTPQKAFKLTFSISQKQIKNGILIEILKVFTFNKIIIYNIFAIKNCIELYVEKLSKTAKKKLVKIVNFSLKKICLLNVFSSKNHLKQIALMYKSNTNMRLKISYNFKNLKIYSNKFYKKEINNLLKKI